MKNIKFINYLPIKSNNLIIRKTNICDTNLLLKLDKDLKVQQFLGGIKNKSFFEREEFINKKIRKFEDGIVGMLTVVLKKSLEPIGFIYFDINDMKNDAKLSYIFDFDYWNKGYCTEVCNKLIEVAFEELILDKVYADTILENKSSIRVLEKIGMVKIGKRQEEILVSEKIEYINFFDYEILFSQYKSGK